MMIRNDTAHFYVVKDTLIREFNHILMAISVATEGSTIALHCDCYTTVTFCVNLVNTLDQERFSHITVNVLDWDGDEVHTNQAL